MSDQEAGLDAETSRSSEGPGGYWMSAVGVVGILATGLILVAAGSGPATEGEAGAGAACRVLDSGRGGPVFTLAWSPNGRELAACGFGPGVRVWDRDSGRVRSVDGGTEQPRFILGWSGDGRRLVLGGLDVPAEAWDLRADRPGAAVDVERPVGRPATLAMIATASRGTPIRVHELAGRVLDWLPDSGAWAISVALSPDGLAVATAEVDKAVRVRDARSGRVLHDFPGDVRGMSCVAFSADGSKVAAGGGGSLRVWDARSGERLATLGGAAGGSAVIGFAPDGKSIAGATWDGSIRIWDLASGLERRKFDGHDGQVLALAWSPDGRTLASGGYDSTVRVWDLSGTPQVARAD